MPLIRSDAGFSSAEDAWNTGRIVLAALERGEPLGHIIGWTTAS
jgi:hypothetical protein